MSKTTHSLNLETYNLMKHLLTLLLLCCICANVSAQKLRGNISDEKGKPIPNSTIYIKELSTGIAADDNGRFELTIEKGTYTCEFRSLGYETKIETISFDKSDKTIHVSLKEKSYLLSEVVVSNKKENPAYAIMRKAIAYAPYYRNQIQSYNAQAYIKGSILIHKIPKLMKLAKIEGEKINFDDLMSRPLVMESINEIDFKAPKKYTQKVKALKTSIPKRFDVSKGLDIMTSSIYDAKMEDAISPLSEGAFNYYTFKLVNVDYQPNRTVNQIQIIPRKKSPILYSGFIYIVENLWNVYAVSLIQHEMGSVNIYRINYQEVKPDTYLPVSYDMTSNIDLLGFKADGRYFASVKYNSVASNANKLPNVFPEQKQIAVEKEMPTSPRIRKIEQKINELSQKSNFTTREAYKMTRLMSELAETDEEKQKRKSLEIKEESNIEKSVDSLATKKDTLFWENTRVIPLQENERISYHFNDSISKKDTSTVIKSGKIEVSIGMENKSPISKIIAGSTMKVNDKFSIGYGGLLNVFKNYNFVDGFWLGQPFKTSYSFDSLRNLTINPAIYYATARKKVLWHTSVNLSYAPKRLGNLYISAGHISRDVNGFNGYSSLLNSFNTLVLGQNYIRYYDSRFFRINNDIELSNGLQFISLFEFEKNDFLKNHTHFSFARNARIAENVPNASSPNFEPHTVNTVALELQYTPFHRYRMRKGAKEYADSSYPTFAIGYRKAFKINNSSSPIFDKLVLNVNQHIPTSHFSNLRYNIGGGAFLNAKKIYMNQYQYFESNPTIVSSNFFNNGFKVLPNYTYSDSYWMEGHFIYNSKYLLFKNLPFLQEYVFDESIHLDVLRTKEIPLYWEVGYSVGIYGLARLGVFAGFEKSKYQGMSVRFSYPMFQFFSKPFR